MTKFWHTVKPFLSDKSTSQSQIKIISEENEVAKSLNNFFKNELENPIEIAITKCDRHPSILAIKNNVATKEFHFTPITQEDKIREFSVRSKQERECRYHSIKNASRIF